MIPWFAAVFGRWIALLEIVVPYVQSVSCTREVAHCDDDLYPKSIMYRSFPILTKCIYETFSISYIQLVDIDRLRALIV
jgi:hypothetical protein